MPWRNKDSPWQCYRLFIAQILQTSIETPNLFHNIRGGGFKSARAPLFHPSPSFPVILFHKALKAPKVLKKLNCLTCDVLHIACYF